MNIVVTGSAGALGSHMAEALTRAGHRVSGIDAFTDYYNVADKRRTAEELKAQGIVTHAVDLATDDLSSALPSSTEAIIHFAAQPGIAATVPFATYERNNVVATARLLEQATTLPNLSTFINIATSSIYGAQAMGDETGEPKPTSYYGVTKLAAEQLALTYARSGKLPVISTRLFSVYGERERPDKLFRKLIAAIYSGEPFTLYEGSREHKRSFTYVGDIVAGLMGVLEHSDVCRGEIINLGTDEVHTTGEAIDLVEQHIGKSANFVAAPKRPGDQLETRAMIDKARKLFNYTPTTSLSDGLKREIEWYRKMQG